MSPQLVSVVIPTYNAIDTLDAQLQALAAQDYPNPFEVIVSDNGSTDHLEEFVASHPLTDHLDLKWVSAASVQGASHARNVGVDNARGDFIAFCDADDTVHRDWLTGLTEIAARYDLVGTAVETDSLNDEKTREAAGIASASSQGQSMFLPYVSGASMGCSKSAYLSVGGMDESLSASEDLEFSWRMQQAGLSLGYVQKPLVSYRLRSGVKSAFRQAFKLGAGSARVCSMYRAAGCPRIRIRDSLGPLMVLSVANPVFLKPLSRNSGQYWARQVGAHLGLIYGGLRHGAFRRSV